MLVTARVISLWRAAPHEGLAYLMRGPLTTQSTAAVVYRVPQEGYEWLLVRLNRQFIPNVQAPLSIVVFPFLYTVSYACFTGNPVHSRFSDIPEYEGRSTVARHGLTLTVPLIQTDTKRRTIILYEEHLQLIYTVLQSKNHIDQLPPLHHHHPSPLLPVIPFSQPYPSLIRLQNSTHHPILLLLHIRLLRRG